MSYKVKAYDPKKINIAPKTDVEEILQNVSMIISTPKFSVPLDRGFGLSQRFVDMPIKAAKSVFIAEIIDAVERNEPRAEVISVAIKHTDVPGVLIPIVEVEINGS